jgi:photosystem II stability/assembly factor-like uncharacterized protein
MSRMLLRSLVALATVLALFAANVSTASAATDYSSRSIPTTLTINDVVFGSDTAAVAVGNGGAIYTTADAGKTWTARTSGTPATLFAADYWPAGGGDACNAKGCIWVGGANGTLLLSTDGGATWCAQNPGTTATINDLFANGPQDLALIGSGGTFIVTDRSAGTGGSANLCGAAAKYRPIPSGTTKDLYDLDVDLNGDLFISGAGGTILQAQGAQSGGPDTLPYTVKPLSSGTTANLYGIASTSDSAGTTTRVIAVGDGGTVVSGTVPLTGTPAFATKSSGTTNTLRDVELETDTTGFAVGDVGTVLNTSDSGTTWTAAKSGTCVNLVAAGYYATNTALVKVASGERGTVIAGIADPAATQPNCSTASLGGNGYRMVASDGGIFTFGNREFHGSTGDRVLNKPIVGGATDVSDYEGYWIVASDGGVFAFDAGFFGSAVGLIDSPAVEIEPTPTGNGYWVVTAKGKVLPFGDAKSYGDMSAAALSQPIIGMSVTATGLGYWLVGQDGGIFTFGDAQFFGSTGATKLNAPVIDLAPTPDNQGYYLVAKDGGVFTFGSADFKGSTGDMKLNAPVVAMLVAPNGAGYWLAASDGGIFTFGAVQFLGSMGGTKLNAPVLDLIN